MNRALFVGASLLFACDPGRLDIGQSTFAIRPDSANAPPEDPHFDVGETVESWDSPDGRVKIHFTRTGRNAVPAADTDHSGIPDYVELTGATYDEVRDLYHGPLGLREPVSDALLGGIDDGGDDLFDVYLVDFAGRADGAFRRDACSPTRRSECTGFMFQENDFAGYNYPSLRYATRVLASHEYYHAVQAAYDADQDTIFNEGTATWAVERFDPTLEDFEGFIGSYFAATDRSLNVAGGVIDSKSYGTGIFFQFLDERFDPLAVPKLNLEVTDGQNGIDDPQWFDRLDPFLAREYQSSFADAFSEFSVWNMYTNSRANPARSYDRGAGYPKILPEAVELPHHLAAPRLFSASARYFIADVDGRAAMTAALAVAEGQDDQLEGLRLYLTALNGGVIVEPKRIDDVRAGTETVATDGASQVIALIVNTNTTGNSKRPDFCLGAVGEVAACIAEKTPGADAGVGNDAGGGGADAGLGGADAGVMNPGPNGGDDGGGCSAVPARDGAALWLLAAFFVALARARTPRR